MDYSSLTEDQKKAFQAGMDAQLQQCCEKLRTRFESLGLSRSQGLSDWLYEECRPAESLKNNLLLLLDTCPADQTTIDLRKKIAKTFPSDLDSKLNGFLCNIKPSTIIDKLKKIAS
jgi:hypothetical protein